jgi:hypothetical protein
VSPGRQFGNVPPSLGTSSIRGMDAAVAGLLGAMVGSLTGLAGSLLTPELQRRTEEAKWKQARADELWREERRALLELTTLLAEGCQAAGWVGWAASVKPLEALRADLAEYDARMRALLPRLSSAQAAAAGVSEGVFDRIDPLVEQLYNLDVAIGNASVQLEDDPEVGQHVLKDIQVPAADLSRQVVRQVSSYLRLDRPAGVWIGKASRIIVPPEPPADAQPG